MYLVLLTRKLKRKIIKENFEKFPESFKYRKYILEKFKFSMFFQGEWTPYLYIRIFRINVITRK